MAVFSYISKFLLNVRANVKTEFKTGLTLFCRNEKGAVEPHAELLSTALAVIGFVVLAALLSHTYQGYEARSFALENYETASVLAQNHCREPLLFCPRILMCCPRLLLINSLAVQELKKEKSFLRLFRRTIDFWLRFVQRMESGTGKLCRTI